MKIIEPRPEPIYSDDPYYDLFDGGYIKPEELLEDPDEVLEAVRVIKEFLELLEEEELMEPA